MPSTHLLTISWASPRARWVQELRIQGDISGWEVFPPGWVVGGGEGADISLPTNGDDQERGSEFRIASLICVFLGSS